MNSFELRLPKLLGSYSYYDEGQLLYHHESRTYFIIAIGEDGIPFWYPSPTDKTLSTDPFSELGVSQHAKGIDPTTSHSVHIPK